MKRVLLVGLVALALIPGVARAVTIGVGAFGGTSTPVLQDDTGSGAVFGLRVPVNFVPLITVEPFFAKSNGGDKTQTVAGLSYTRDGIDVTSYGANVLFTFGTGIQLYPFAGIGSSNLKRTGLDATQTSYDFGLGLGFKLPGIGPVSGLSANVRGALDMVTDPASTQVSRKWGEVSVGVSYGVFHFPPLVP
jgi:hypothetical protein